MLDICYRCDKDDKVRYVWFDTGLEYQATKDHLRFLESKYGIEIETFKAIKPIPKSCRMYGQPFLNKLASEFIQRLQKHNFQWEDEEYEVLIKKYPKCQSALEWWCNKKKSTKNSIANNKWLKEFMIENPPKFRISNKCCYYAKKKVARKLIEENGYDLNIVGVRKAEGGVRATAYKNCFTENETDADEYRPVFWYKDSDKQEYEENYGVCHSNCYKECGLKRTGCSCCSYGKDFEEELKAAEIYEPNLYKAVNNIFKQSYEYTRQYREFVKRKNEEQKKTKRNK